MLSTKESETDTKTDYDVVEKEYSLIIRKMLKAKSVELHDHSVLTANILRNMVVIADKNNCTMPISPRVSHILGLLHDVGKCYVNDIVLNKQESLTSREWETIKLHPAWGKKFVEGTRFAELGKFIIQHHEKEDGSGYPNKLSGSSIFEVSHLVSIADQIASLVEDRPYRRGIEDKLTLESMLVPSIKHIFGSKTKGIMSETLDLVLQHSISSKPDIEGILSHGYAMGKICVL